MAWAKTGNVRGPTGADSTVPGPVGPPGTAATLAAGNTATLAAGTPATVTQRGTAQAAIFDFGIPQGIKGDPGVQGPAGSSYTLPVGTVILYVASGAPPNGWLDIDGSAISRSLYPELFALIGTSYGAGDGSTTFNLPDGRGRVAVVVGQGVGLTNRILADTGGEETHRLTIAELAAHNHTQSAHSHNVAVNFSCTSGTTQYGPGTYPGAGAFAGTNPVTPAIQNAGGDGAHNNMQPFVAYRYIIKVSLAGGSQALAPIADTTQDGLLRKLSGKTTDFVDGTNNCRDIGTITGIPSGVMWDWPGPTPPVGWFLCDGKTYSRTTYANLYAALGGASSPWGQGDGSTTFNVPDLRGRVSIGAGQGSGLTNRLVADQGGEEAHKLIITELASHNHTQPAHAHTVNSLLNQGSQYVTGSIVTIYASGGGSTGAAFAPGTTAIAPAINPTGGDTPHNNMPPFAVVNKIIKS